MKVNEFYDAGADIYQKQCSTIYFIKEKIDEYISKLPSGALVADFGCGPGNEVKHHSNRLNFVGIDFSLKMLDHYRKCVANAEVVHCDIKKISLPNFYFDSGICLFSLNHQDENLAIEGLREIKRVTKPFGKVLICIGAGQDNVVSGVLSGFDSIPNIEPIPFYLWSKERLIKLIEETGFKLVNFVEDFLLQDRGKYFWIEIECMPTDDHITERLPNSWRAKQLNESLLNIRKEQEFSGISRTSKINTLVNLSVPIYSVTRPKSNVHITVASGKGLSDDESLASAYFEAFEIATSELPTRPRVQKTLNEIRNSALPYIEPERFGQYGFAEDSAFDWVYMKDLECGSDLLIPVAMITMSLAKEPFKSHSNGLSSGNGFYESVFHGLLEVCERHAHSWALVQRVARSLKDYEIHLDEPVQKILKELREQNISIEVNDLSQQIGIPVYYVVTRNHFLPNIKAYNSGFGCHIDPRIALTRAITEAIQSLAGTVSGAREDLATKQFEHSENALKFMDFWANASDKPISFFSDSLPVPDCRTFRDAITLTLAKARTADPRLGRCLVYSYPTASPIFHVTRVVVERAECFGLNRNSLGVDMYSFIKGKA